MAVWQDVWVTLPSVLDGRHHQIVQHVLQAHSPSCICACCSLAMQDISTTYDDAQLQPHLHVQRVLPGLSHHCGTLAHIAAACRRIAYVIRHCGQISKVGSMLCPTKDMQSPHTLLAILASKPG